MLDQLKQRIGKSVLGLSAVFRTCMHIAPSLFRVLLATVVSTPTVFSQKVVDCRGVSYGSGAARICLPQGEISFVDEVVSFVPGKRAASEIPVDPNFTLGAPDYTTNFAPGYLSLGCDGVLTLRFVDNALVDIDGPDLYIFEVGPAVEPTILAISTDNRTWLDVGRVEGALRAVDIRPFIMKGQIFRYVRLTNAGHACGGTTPGADIDAVAAVGSASLLTLDAAVLFDTGHAVLRAEAANALNALTETIRSKGPNVRIMIEGHTDDVGSDQDNQRLSEARARTVRTYLRKRLPLSEAAVTTVGFGESRPTEPNDSEEGRAKNRRVDILVIPDS